MKTLKQLRDDPRFDEIEVFPGENPRYFYWLSYGWNLEGNQHCSSAETVAQMNDDLRFIRPCDCARCTSKGKLDSDL
jgi:hypothetical protein